ncbi:MAG: hypothetical protein CBB71_04060 [Rhodopirellula sp. TMED11]|nr:MAG: hypothetical protein CBB71_04060 [Rhodopirellula sp. TMED11]
MKEDQGSENQGAAKDGLAEDNIMVNEGGVDRHPDQADVENFFNRVQICAATIGVGAMEHNEEYIKLTMGTRIKHSADLLKYRPCGKIQIDQGTCPIVEQFHPQCMLEKPKIAYGELIFIQIEKKDRPNKTGARAMMGIYAGQDRRVAGNIIAHPISPKADRSGWNIHQSLSVLRYVNVPGYFVLVHLPDSKTVPPSPEGHDILTYDDIMAEFDNQEQDPDDLSDGEHEVEIIKDHSAEEADVFSYLVGFKGYDASHDLWFSQDDMAGCEEIIAEYWQNNPEPNHNIDQIIAFISSEDRARRETFQNQNFQNRSESQNRSSTTLGAYRNASAAADIAQIEDPDADPDQIVAFINSISGEDYKSVPAKPTMYCIGTLNQDTVSVQALSEYQVAALVGEKMHQYIFPVVEIPPKEFIKMDGGTDAVKTELDQMSERRFNNTKPIPAHIKHTALECRIICTQKRDGRMKARLVAKDLKARRKLPATSTYAAVPAMYGFKLLIAAADGKTDIVSTTDFTVAYLQSENRDDHTTWVLIKYRCPFTNQWIYTWIMGEIYGGQKAGKTWKDSLAHKMIMVGGFVEVKNMENMFYHPYMQTAVSIHVDDPLIVNKTEEGYEASHDFLEENFDTKGRNKLEMGKEIDYLSMEITLNSDYDIVITNRAKSLKFLADAGMSDCYTTTKPPMTKASLKAAMAFDTPLSEIENTARLADNGRFGWLAQTTHIGLVTATSIAQGLPPIEGTKQVAKSMYQWLKTHCGDGLISRSGVRTGLEVCTDADWGGLHSVTGEVRSRTGVAISYNEMLVDQYSGLQKTIASHYHEWDEDEPRLQYEQHIATSTANAEVVAAAEGIGRALHITYIGSELGIPMPEPIQIDIDASAAIGFLENTGGSGRMKHLDIKAGWIQLARDNSVVQYNKVDGKTIKANFFTKLLDKTEFDREYAALAYMAPAEAAEETTETDEEDKKPSAEDSDSEGHA